MNLLELPRRLLGLGRQKHSAAPRASYRGATIGRLFRDWVASILHPDRELRGNLRLLRARARDLVRNNSYASGFVDELADNIIGPAGIQLQARVTDRKGELRKQDNWALEEAWKEWGAPEWASADGQSAWVDMERLAIRTIAVDGEAFFRKLPGYDNGYGFSLQMLDADLLDETFERPPDANGVEIRMGIEQDEYGRRVAYHFWRRHPSDRYFARNDRIRIAADEIIHLFVKHRAGQSRGVTWFAPVMADVHQLNGLTEAELVATRVAAAKMGFIVNKSETAVEAWIAKIRARLQRDSDPEAEDGDADDEELRSFDAAPGVIDELAPGQEFQGFDPTHPSSSFEPFVKTILRGIARGLGTTYARLTGDLEGANYSSMRAGELPVRDRFRSIQTWMAMHFHRRVYRAWLPVALISGHVKVDSRLASDFQKVTWNPRGWKSVDPKAEVAALEAEIALGVNSRTRACAERGGDFEEIIDELKEEAAYAKAAGIAIAGTAAMKAGGSERREAEESEDEDERLALAS